MLFDREAFRGHEQVVLVSDPARGLRAIIAVHSTCAGPSCGGVRFHSYASDEDALDDVLRLSHAMTLKCALAELPLGGGKSVILGDPSREKTPAVLEAFGSAVERLGRAYIAAEDVGMSPDDLAVVARATRHVAGLKTGPAASGDPSPFTARGVLRGIEAAVRERLGRADLAGLTVGVLGLGHVGMALADFLHRSRAALLVADIAAEKASAARDRFGARVVAPGALAGERMDVFAPCALGGILDRETIDRLRAPVVAGAANNQLEDESAGDELHRRGILYAPDFAINAGGVINVAAEISGRYVPREVEQRVDRIGGTLGEIFDRARAEDRPTHRVAMAMAEERLRALVRRGPAPLARAS